MCYNTACQVVLQIKLYELVLHDTICVNYLHFLVLKILHEVFAKKIANLTLKIVDPYKH